MSATVAATTPDPLAAAGGRAPRPPYAVLVVLAGACAAGLLVALPWLVNAYLISLAATALVMAVLAMSTQLLAGVAGLPPLGQAAYLGIGAYAAAAVARSVTTSGPAQLAAAALAGAVAAAVTGLLAVRGRNTTFLMITFAIGELMHAAAVHWAPGGSEGVHTPPTVPLPGLPAIQRDGWTYLYVLACAAVLAGGVGLLMRTRFVLTLRATAAHEPRMRACGHDINRLLLASYTIAGGLAGAAGALLVAIHRYVAPGDLAFGVSALALAAAVIGVGSMTGACAGAVLLVAARDWAGGLLGGYGTTVLGLLLITMAYLPRHRLPLLGAGISGRRQA
jgi:branched-chain amino acid transport system permease protein